MSGDRRRPRIYKYCDMQDLLNKMILNSEQLNEVSGLTEAIILAFLHQESFDVSIKSPFYALVVLARRFLVFDLVICALEVGQVKAEGAWWQTLISGVTHVYPEPGTTAIPTEKGRVDRRHLIYLCEALSMLKT